MPYWQVPRLAAYATLSIDQGHITLTCSKCSHVIQVFDNNPTVKEMVKVAKTHTCQG